MAIAMLFLVICCVVGLFFWGGIGLFGALFFWLITCAMLSAMKGKAY